MWEVLCRRVSENPSCEGGDVELGARTSKHNFVFVFDPLSLTLSLLYCALHHFILFIYTYILGIVCLCVILVLKTRELHIASQLLFRGI